jgi:hypothetical protein
MEHKSVNFAVSDEQLSRGKKLHARSSVCRHTSDLGMTIPVVPTINFAWRWVKGTHH